MYAPRRYFSLLVSMPLEHGGSLTYNVNKKEVRNQYRELEQEYANISQISNYTCDQTILFLVQNESAVQSTGQECQSVNY